VNAPWQLPRDWQWAIFKDVARVASDLVDPSEFLDVPHIAPNHIEREMGRLLPYTTVRDDGVFSAKHRFHRGQLLYCKIRPYLAKVVLVDFEGLCSADMYPIDTDLDPRFLKWWMLTREFTRRAAGEQARTVLPKINRRALGQLPVPVPPFAEQRRIVDILEDHLSRLDAGDLYLDSAGRRLVALRRSTLDEQFGVYGHDVRLGELVTGIEAGRSFGGSTGPACSDDWGIIKVSAMTWGEFRPQENKAVPAEQADPRYEIHEGDLLVSRANTGEYVGASVLVGPVRGRLLLSDKSLRLNIRPGVRPDWLWRALQSPSARGQMSALATGTKDSMRNISQKSLLQVRLPAHDSDHQRAAVNQFQAVEDALGVLALQLAGWHKGAFAIRRAMLAAAFSGRMTGRHTDQEVIEELVDE